MLHVRTEVRNSSIHGLGLFSRAPLKAGALVWRFHPKIDHTYTANFLETIPDDVARQLRRYCYVNPENPELLVICGDDARFMNFPATGQSATTSLGMRRHGEYELLAARDIEAGEELTAPLESDLDATRKLGTSI